MKSISLSNWLSSQSTKIEVQENNGSVSATIGSFRQIKSQRLKNEAGEQMAMQNVGFAMVFQFNNQSADLAPSEGSQWHDPDMPRQWESELGGK